MSTRVPPIERIRAEIDQAFSSERPLGEVMEEVARLGLRLLVQTVIEAEVTEFLGRERYAHGDRARDGHRNGHSPLTVKTTAGSVTIQRPKVRGTGVAFASRLLGKSVTKSNAFESLVIAGFVRGLSMRDIEASISEALGPEATVSKSTVSRICEAIHHEFETWRLRDLSDIELDYLFLDASHFRMHPGSKAEPILAAWGITTEGAPVFIGLSPAGSESDDAWHGFLADLEARGLRSPLLGISDGAPGLTGAFDRAFPTAERQRCLVHRCRNLVAKVSKKDQQQVKADFWSIFDDIDAPPGKKAIAVAEGRRKEFELRWKATYPAAVACLADDFEHLTTHLRFPTAHRKRIRHSNFIERTFGETRRRVKVIGRLPGERSCVSLVFAVLDRASRGWRGVTMTAAGTRLLQDLRREIFGPPPPPPSTDDHEEVLQAAA